MLQCGRSRYESVMLSLKDPPPKPSSLLPSEHGEEEDADAAKAAATAVSAKDLMVVGQRVKVCFRREANDSVGQWFGGIVAKVTRDADLCVIALDDGDSVVYTAAEMRGLIELRKFGKLEDTRGMVTDVWQAERALSVSCVKVGTVLHPAGVLVGDGVTTLCEKPFRASPFTPARVEKAFSGSKLGSGPREAAAARETTSWVGWQRSSAATLS